MRGALAVGAAGVAVIACCAALPVALAVLGGAAAAFVIGSLGVALAAVALLAAVAVRRRRVSYALPLPSDRTMAAPPQIKVRDERPNR